MSYESPSGPMPPAQPSALGLNQVGRADEVRPPRPDEALSANACRDDRRISVEFLTLAVIAALALAWVGGTQFVTNGLPSFGNGAVTAIVEQIIAVESGGDSNARNKRSSATGAGQFLDETWLEMIRTYRRDLVEGRSEKEILELRLDPELTRAIMMRLVEQNAAMAVSVAQHGYVMETGRIVLEGSVEKLRDNADIREFYLGLNEVGSRKSYRDVKHYKRRKRWLS